VLEREPLIATTGVGHTRPPAHRRSRGRGP
jgi:hypothetical protein